MVGEPGSVQDSDWPHVVHYSNPEVHWRLQVEMMRSLVAIAYGAMQARNGGGEFAEVLKLLDKTLFPQEPQFFR